ncbi:glycoside hydrolase family 3 N-terminal domain-containing protein [Corynebacterium diphtheriae]|uniref:glycoside hydrolase family 3 N-terminal domain-containing protein n=1 Tax=Corynebacterium diphtheriae TaxID=1717 RepID=UPI00089337A4|nr:glycoside hydrolase family 3 N-terminal domain-containing protein [Corynebacterium diphtheriae]OFI53180.1 beta-N-acetylglucosaminidase [Corynebacterium diphtheriae]OSQ20766.1 beta-N-acetylglucosaminidase [Corynebacterium diphtheriae]
MDNLRRVFTPVSLILGTVVAASMLSSCSQDSSQQAAPSTPSSTPTASQSEQPSSAMSATSSTPQAVALDPVQLRKDAASLMMVGVGNFDDALFAIQQGAGGIFIGSGTDPQILTTPGRDIAELRRIAGRPLSVAIDFEGGRVLRHRGILGDFPSPQVMAQTMTPEQVRGMAYDMGRSLFAHGINVNFAPVVDIEAGLEVVGDRAFSPDPLIDATYATAFAQGMADAGVRPVLKHFPGHGRASGDSHTAQVHTPPLAELEKLDLIPYGRVPVAGAGVMVGHMIVPGLGAPETPSTINPAAYQLLRSGSYPGGQPFSGVIYTDDLTMGAVTSLMPTVQAVPAALAAGADQALWVSTAGLVEAIDATVAAVSEGRYPVEQFKASVARVAG